MIIGLGCDIVNIERLQKSSKFLQNFKRKILGENELAELERLIIDADDRLAAILAKRFAVKEAFVKALGCGFADEISFKEIETLHNDSGRPYLHISGQAAKKLQQLSNAPKLHLSLSDDYPYAQAFVIIEE